MGKIWAAPFAFLYGCAIWVRHKLFDWGVLRSQHYDFPVICVGNITVGGTGKTPFSEFLIRSLSGQYRIALLSRGYGRRTKGYLEVTSRTRFLDSGDEPKQIKTNFPDIVVAVCEKRTEGIRRIREEHPEVNLIIMDDGFQHRYVQTWADIVLMDCNRPIYRDTLLPRGTLRDLRSQMHRAGYVVVTKCSPNMAPIDRRLVRKSLGLYPYQNLYFSIMEQGRAKPVFPADAPGPELKPQSDAIAMSAIGNPESFRRGLARKYNVVDELVFSDHHPYRKRDLVAMAKLLEEYPGAAIITTEKDRVKLMNPKKIPAAIRQRLYYIPVRVSFHEETAADFLNKLNYDIRTNPKDRILRS